MLKGSILILPKSVLQECPKTEKVVHLRFEIIKILNLAKVPDKEFVDVNPSPPRTGPDYVTLKYDLKS